jgi:hypothetical protein
MSCSRRMLWCCISSVVLGGMLLVTPSAHAQVWHLQDRGDAPPGVIGMRQLERGGPRPGYFQPVQVTAPNGALISLACEGGYTEPRKEKTLAAMLIGPVYRLQISNIQFHEGDEVYPTIEVIDRLYPPPGQAARFPIPIELTQEELEMALDGRYVQRVIYIEPPESALPVNEIPGKQRFFEVFAKEDPLDIADRLGRPVAILRMGSRVPAAEEVDDTFNYQSPPLMQFEAPPEIDRKSGLEEPLEAPPRLGRPSRNFLRVPESKMR